MIVCSLLHWPFYQVLDRGGGQWIAYTGFDGIVVQPFPGPGGRNSNIESCRCAASVEPGRPGNHVYCAEPEVDECDL